LGDAEEVALSGARTFADKYMNAGSVAESQFL